MRTIGLLLLFSFNLAGQTFTDVGQLAGIDSLHGNHVDGDLEFGAGAAWLDYNKDGDLDIYVINRNKGNYLFKNNGDGTFTDVAEDMGVDDKPGDGGGIAVADFNNDGYPDLFLANSTEDRLYKNNNGTSFTDISFSAGITISGDNRGTSASWGDYDKDGYLDLYVSIHDEVQGNVGSQQDYLFYNNGDETFSDASSVLGIENLESANFIGGFTDFDNDMDLDILLIVDCPYQGNPTTTLLFRNDGGDDPLNWNFTEVSVETGINDCSAGMGLGVGDYNRDGLLDYVYSNIGPAKFFRNDGGTFTDVSDESGVAIQEIFHYTWGTSFLDYNNDGFQDIIMATGDRDVSEGSQEWANYLFENNGDDTFTDVAGAVNLDDTGRTRAMIHGDYDNDGDLDIFITNYADTFALKRNDISNGNHYLKINLVGTESNKDGIGSFIKIKTPDGVYQYFETRSGSNLGGGDAPGAHFGLLDNTSVDSIIVNWPLGQQQVLTDIDADQLITIVEPDIPLSVELIDFAAISNEKEILLTWTTSSELNNNVFYVQKSNTGKDFRYIGTVAGKGNSDDKSFYSFIDSSPFSGDNYYRLKQENFDGTFEYSKIIKVSHIDIQNMIRIYPNPLDKNYFTVEIKDNKPWLNLDITDIYGQLVYQKKIEGPGHKVEQVISAGSWPAGLYLIHLYGNNNHITRKIVKTK